MTDLAPLILFFGKRAVELRSTYNRDELRKLAGPIEAVGFDAGRLYLQAVNGYFRNIGDGVRALAWLTICKQIEILIDLEIRKSSGAVCPDRAPDDGAGGTPLREAAHLGTPPAPEFSPAKGDAS